MKTQHPHARRRRALGAMFGLLFMFTVLVGSFFRVQVLASSDYKLQAEQNRLKRLDVPAPRGTIYDRNGRIIADNVPGYAVTILPASHDSIMATIAQLRPFVKLTDLQVSRLDANVRRYPRQPVTVSADVGIDAAAALLERRGEFPNVYIEMRPQRRYPSGRAVSHILGYIGEITSEEIGTEEFPLEKYQQGMIVGKTGIERQYESILQGQAGTRYVEVDAKGRIVGDFSGSTSKPGVSGGDLRLSIDLELQEWIDRIFPKDRMGAVVAIDPADGSILALYSAPTFDPNDFVGGIEPDLWKQLNTDPNKPLYNRAVLGLYPPASTFKLATAAIALDMGIIGPDDHMPVPCTGGYAYGNRVWHCWKPGGHGSLDLAGAIKNSCDVYFYQLGLKIGLARMLEEGTNNIGLNRKCGVDLPEEKAGVWPTDVAFWKTRFGYSPNEGESLSLAIGQGPNSQTPLKMAQFYTALARDGSVPAPSFFTGRLDKPEGFTLKLSPEGIATLREGMREVTGPGGTAYMSSLRYWDLIGKTGTGQNTLSLKGLAEDHAWFAAIAGPIGRAPEIVVVVLCEYCGGGSAVSGPLAAKTADFYLRRKYGIPVDTVQTLGETYAHGQRAWPPHVLPMVPATQ